MHLSINIPDDMWERLEELPKAELVRLIRIGRPQKTVAKKKKNLMHYFGSIQGVYASADEADRLIRNERDKCE